MWGTDRVAVCIGCAMNTDGTCKMYVKEYGRVLDLNSSMKLVAGCHKKTTTQNSPKNPLSLLSTLILDYDFVEHTHRFQNLAGRKKSLIFRTGHAVLALASR